VELADRRTAMRQLEYMDFAHTVTYKELGRLDAMGYQYRIPKLEAQ